MSKMKFRNFGNWYSPTTVNYNQNGSWIPVNKVYIKEANAWEEVWPASSGPQPIVADYVMFTISIANASDWPNLIFEMQGVNPNWGTIAAWRGGKGHADVNANIGAIGGPIADNTRGTFGSEDHQGTVRVGRQELKFGNGIYGAVANSDNYMFRVYPVTNPPGFTQFVNNPIYNKVIVNFSAIFNDYVTNGLFDWNDPDLGIGTIIRNALFIAWTDDFTGNPATENITIQMDVYQGGSYTVDQTTNAVTFTGYTASQSYSQILNAQQLNYDYYPTSPLLNFDYCAVKFDWDFTTDIVSIGSYTAPTQTTLPQFLAIDCYNGDHGTNLQLWIDSPRFDPSVYLDAPYYETNNGVLSSTIKYYQRTYQPWGTNYAGSGPGMDTPTETFTDQFGGAYGVSAMDAYPYVFGLSRVDKLWWMIGRTGSDMYPTALESWFDIHQYQYDNPGITSVTIKAYGFQDPNTPVLPRTVWAKTYNGTKLYNFVNNQALVANIGSATRTVQISTNWPPSYGTPIAEITIDYTTDTITITAL